MKTMKLACTAILLMVAARLASAQTKHAPSSEFPSYKGLVMAGYQGWFHNPSGGEMYADPNDIRIDMWPDVSEYKKTYPTAYRHADGSVARFFCSDDESTVKTHFRWMKQYGLDGVFVQRFFGSAMPRRNGSREGSATVLKHALKYAQTYHRAVSVMYDLSGLQPGRDDCMKLVDDWKYLVDSLRVTSYGKKNMYLFHKDRPLVVIWGVGFPDRPYDIRDIRLGEFIDFLHNDSVYGGCSVMLGVPTYWRTLEYDSVEDPYLHELIRKADLVLPWMVQRFSPLVHFDMDRYRDVVRKDMAWCREAGVDYVPLIYPGFSWHNLSVHAAGDVIGDVKPVESIPRQGGRFYWAQAYTAIKTGAEMLYVAMFDEVNEGTAIFKVSDNPPVSDSAEFADMDGMPSDHYLFLTGEIARMLRGERELGAEMPKSGRVTTPGVIVSHPLERKTEIKASCGGKEPVDYVNPYIGNISHLLVPTFPTVQLPNSMLRVYPERSDYTAEHVNGLPVTVTNHRERSAFKISVTDVSSASPVVPVTYDNEHLTPYGFSIDLDDGKMHADYAVSHQSAVYSIDFKDTKDPVIVVNSASGEMSVSGRTVSGRQSIDGRTSVYVYMVFDRDPLEAGALRDGRIARDSRCEGDNAAVALRFSDNAIIGIRYGVSFISTEQARANLEREIRDFDLDAVASEGRKIWNDTLGRIEVEGGSESQKSVFYTSYYRTFERPVCMSEDGRYWSAFDGKVHEDGGVPFYNDDWVWDTYRAAHPLRILMDSGMEESIVESFLRMADHMNGWLPTFPEVTGDSRRMNSNHSIAIVADAVAKGLKVDLDRAYDSCYKALKEKTLAPWCGNPAGWLDEFYWKHGYIPALRPGERETDPNVHHFEKRQPVAVTLGTAYDCWCMSQIAAAAGKEASAEYFREFSSNYKTLFNDNTLFFHPKDSSGRWIEPFDYRFSGGLGAREYYDENNGWTYRWDVQHDIPGLIGLMGGPERFVKELDSMFAEPLGKGKFEFYAQLPDQTGNVGQFTMANEPSLHIPYLYNYAGAPWKTQKRIRQLLKTWFRDDLMGVPGDEDGGGLSSFVVFSSLGFYPVTPGSNEYQIGSPVFGCSRIRLSNGKEFSIVAHNVSDDNKYIQSMRLNGETLDSTCLTYGQICSGGCLELEMGPFPVH